MTDQFNKIMQLFRPKRIAYYRVTIDYNWDTKKEGRQLNLCGNKNSNSDMEDLLKSVRQVITKELPEEMAKAYNIKVKTHITLETEGSIVIVFSAVFSSLLGIYYFIAKYPNFKEGCKVLREDAERMLSRLISKRSKSMTVSIHLVSPSVEKYSGREPLVPVLSSDYFWPMMVSLLFNIILGTLLLVLVWHAINHVYF